MYLAFMMILPGPLRTWQAQTLRIMKLTAIILLAIGLHASAGIYSQQVTLKVKNLPLRYVFAKLEAQTGYFFAYAEGDLKPSGNITADLEDVPLFAALNSILKDFSLSYTYSGKFIIIKPWTKNDLAELLPPIKISGIVFNHDKQPLIGATIRIKGAQTTTTTNEKGYFEITAESGITLIISYVGFKSEETRVVDEKVLNIFLTEAIADMDTTEVILNTGYQKTSPERTTGSFAQMDNALLNRRVGANVLDRLEGAVSGLVFNSTDARGNKEISIRGRNTIFSNADPLIVVDNFPYEGAITNINPNDIESITILKDAAAASIWGARAGNGVIVISTKKGRLNTKTRVDFNSNVTVRSKPDLFSLPRMKTSDLINVEKYLFDKGFYDNNLNNVTTYPAVSPVVEILSKAKNSQITDQEAARQIDMLRNLDNRNDLLKYSYKNEINQQYSLNASGGSSNANYLISVGYDNALGALKNKNQRINVRSQSALNLLQGLQINGDLVYTQHTLIDAKFPGSASLYPYERLVDGEGRGIVNTNAYRQKFIDQMIAKGFLDWSYNPIYDAQLTDRTVKRNEIRLALGSRYKIINAISIDANYQFQKQSTSTQNYKSPETYYTRDLINKYSQRNASGEVVKRPVPLGGIMDLDQDETIAHSGRLQLNFSRQFYHHFVSGIAGYEVREVHNTGNGSRIYGYDAEYTLSKVVNFDSLYLTTPNNLRAQIPSPPGLTADNIDRNRSFYSNVAYAYKGRYTLSASARKDESNYFGAKSNQRAIPLWSSGIKWDINKESFYACSWLPLLEFRATYGYNGNINKSVTAFTTASYGVDNNNITTAIIINPPNGNLSWEKSRIINLGINFNTKGNILTGSIEYYTKKSIDLIGYTAIDPTTGIESFQGNVASMNGRGWDLILKSVNISRAVNWQTDFIFSYAKDKITDYTIPASAASVLSGESITPVIGRPVFGMYSYYWAGLDNAGDPQGYLNKEKSKDYSKINIPDIDDLRYNGPVRVPFFGSFRNTISYRQISLSANILYKMGHYFRCESINYSSLYNSYTTHKDYEQRWQQPGDETKTDVPAMQYINYPQFLNRNQFYGFSEILVEKGDHIRLQDIQVNYNINKKTWIHNPFNNVQIYAYVNNLGILWRVNKYGIDPDYQRVPSPVRTYAIGLKASW